MKITAIASKKPKVGEHTILKVKSGAFEPGFHGFVSFVGKSEFLALSGHFDFEIVFSPNDIDAINTASKASLLARIDELLEENHKLKSSN